MMIVYNIEAWQNLGNRYRVLNANTLKCGIRYDEFCQPEWFHTDIGFTMRVQTFCPRIRRWFK